MKQENDFFLCVCGNCQHSIPTSTLTKCKCTHPIVASKPDAGDINLRSNSHGGCTFYNKKRG